LQESLLMPGVSVSFLHRDLPTLNVVGQSGSDELSVTDLKVKTTAWRVTASKSLILFGIALGAGQDKYDQGAKAQATVQAPIVGQQQSQVITLDQNMTRTSVFADLSMNLPFLKLVGEI